MTDLDRSRLMSRLFTRPVMEEIARQGSAIKVVKQLKALGETWGDKSVVADLFNQSFDRLRAHYRCEYVYKAAIATRIVFGRHSPRTSSMAVELGVAGSIVDVAVFNGTSTAYEVKTELDSHRRLVSQTPDYLRAFDRVYVVTHPDLAQRYASCVDERVGVLCLNVKGQLQEFRAPISDTARIEPSTVFRMLRRQEYMDAVNRHFGNQPDLPNGLISQHYSALLGTLTATAAHRVLVHAMRRRTTDNESVDFVSALPHSLRALAYATPLSRPQRQKFLKALAASA